MSCYTLKDLIQKSPPIVESYHTQMPHVILLVGGVESLHVHLSPYTIDYYVLLL